MTSCTPHLPRRALAVPNAPMLVPSTADVRDAARLRVSLLRRRFGLEDATARLIASLAYGDPRQ